MNPIVKAAVVLSVLAANFSSAVAEEKGLSSEELLKLVGKLDALTLVTPEAHKMRPWVALLCRMPKPTDWDHANLVSNRDALYKIYVTSNGADAFKDEKAAFPAGTVVLKKKFLKASESAPELYTGMLKREAGYNPDCGDWEFFTVAGDGKTLSDRGKMESCMNCHRLYKESDFVTKNYK